MTYIRIDPIVSLVRIYKIKINRNIPLYKMKERYYKSFPIEYLDDGSVRIVGVVEAPTIKEKIELQKYLKEQGYCTVSWRHNDKSELFTL